MNPGEPDVINQLPASGNPMEPKSGTYGNVVETERLKQSLDLPGGPGGAAARPSSPPPPGQPQGRQMQAPSGGIPDVLMKPTSRPDVAPSTPLQPQTPQGQQHRANHVSALEALVASPTTSQTTKRWAEAVLERYKA